MSKEVEIFLEVGRLFFESPVLMCTFAFALFTLALGVLSVMARLLLRVLEPEPMEVNTEDIFKALDKKSYSDEMSIYSDDTLPEPRTGISLDDLVSIRANDGELPESAYSTK